MDYCAIYLSVFLAFVFYSAAHGQGYFYNEPEQWPQDYPTCNSSRQSPINLTTYSADWYTESNLRSLLLSFELHGYTFPADGVFTNDGRTVTLQLNYTDPSTTPRIVVALNDTTVLTLYLRNMTIHWPSEHWVDNDRFLMEVQMLHVDPIINVTWIISYFFDYCDPPRSGMDIIGSAASDVTNAGESVNLSAFVPQSIMPYGRFSNVNMCDYFFYVGSLTSPPCTEPVTWAVYSKPQCVSFEQMNVTLFDKNGRPNINNARPLQPLNNRSYSYLPCQPY